MTFFALAFLLLLPGNIPATDKCGCVKARRDDTTRWGVNESVVYVYRTPYKQIRGVVDFPKKANILVEVFTHPEHLLPDYPQDKRQAAKESQRRVAACTTGADGEFCFRNIPAGKYELRLSIDAGWNPTHVYLVLAPRNRKSIRTKLRVNLDVGK